MPEYYYEKCYDFMDHSGMSQEPSGPMHHTWSAGLIQGMPNTGCILKEGKAFKNTYAQVQSQTNWVRTIESGAQASVCFKSFPGVSSVSRVEKLQSGLSGIWTCFQVYVSSFLLYYSDFPHILWCAKNTYPSLFQLIQILSSVKNFSDLVKKVIKTKH